MKDEVRFEVQSYDEFLKVWFEADTYHRKKDAKIAIRDFQLRDGEHGLVIKYRILKLTIKKEVVE